MREGGWLEDAERLLSESFVAEERGRGMWARERVGRDGGYRGARLGGGGVEGRGGGGEGEGGGGPALGVGGGRGRT